MNRDEEQRLILLAGIEELSKVTKRFPGVMASFTPTQDAFVRNTVLEAFANGAIYGVGRLGRSFDKPL